jgi:chemotaxis protein methyltransferase CheR
MTDPELVAFLQWALPRLSLRWAGFRKVRGQVRKRIHRRLRELGLPDLAAYRAHLEREPDEWAQLAAMCRITISRFWRDRGVFDWLTGRLPELATTGRLRAWSAGCAGGRAPPPGVPRDVTESQDSQI